MEIAAHRRNLSLHEHYLPREGEPQARRVLELLNQLPLLQDDFELRQQPIVLAFHALLGLLLLSHCE